MIRRPLLVALITAVMLGVVGVGSALASDLHITSDPTASTPSAYGGIVAWSRMTSGGHYKLVVVSLGHGVVYDAEAKSSREAFLPDVGPDSKGHPVVVWARCRHSNTGCDIHRYKPATHHDTIVDAVSTSHSDEIEPVQWKGRYVFRRCNPTSGVCHGRTRNGTGPTRSVSQLSDIAPSDLRGSRLLYATDRQDNGVDEEFSAVRAVKVGLSHSQHSCAIDTNARTDAEGAFVFNPMYDGSRVYWRESGDRGELVLRTDGTSPCGANHQVGSREINGTIALTDATLIYKIDSGIYRADDPPESYSPEP